VVGSANADLVARCQRLPAPGETVLASGLSTHPGGKGLNQAVAAARDGAVTAFIGAVGDDAHAGLLRAALTDSGVDVSRLSTVTGPSGTALICVDDQGANTIVVAAGANVAVRAPGPALAPGRGDVLVLQLEIPEPAVRATAMAARAAGALVVLNAAPARTLDRELLAVVDHLVVNETEALTLSGPGANADPATSPATNPATDRATDPATDAIAAATDLLAAAASVVLTRGAAGAVVLRRDAAGRPTQPLPVPATAVDAVDTTGAGDTFVGVLAAGLARGAALDDAVRRAVAAATISVTRSGAVPSIPDRSETDAATQPAARPPLPPD